jgi:hypothetical protein
MGGGAEIGPGVALGTPNPGDDGRLPPPMTGAVAAGVGTGIAGPVSIVTPVAGRPPGKFVPPVAGKPGSGTKTGGALGGLPTAPPKLGALNVLGALKPLFGLANVGPAVVGGAGCNKPGGLPGT